VLATEGTRLPFYNARVNLPGADSLRTQSDEYFLLHGECGRGRAGRAGNGQPTSVPVAGSNPAVRSNLAFALAEADDLPGQFPVRQREAISRMEPGANHPTLMGLPV